MPAWTFFDIVVVSLAAQYQVYKASVRGDRALLMEPDLGRLHPATLRRGREVRRLNSRLDF